MKRRTYLFLGLAALSFLLLQLRDQAEALPPPEEGVKWSESVLEFTVMPGTMQSKEIIGTSRVDLTGVWLRVVPPPKGILRVRDEAAFSVQAREAFSSLVIVDVPLDTPERTYRGIIQLRAEHEGRMRRPRRGGGGTPGVRETRVVPEVLPVIIHVKAPTDVDIPVGSTCPSQDRIVQDPSGQKLIKDEVVVLLDMQEPDPEGTIRDVARATGGVILGSIPQTKTYQLRYPVTDLVALEAKIAEVHALAEVELAAHNLIGALDKTPNDDFYGWDWDDGDDEDWDGVPTDSIEYPLEQIDAPLAWDIETGCSSVNVAVIDSEFDTTHEDLKNRIGHCPYPMGDVSVHDGARGHGTHVAGIIGAQGNNGKGVTGVAWDVTLNLYDLSSFVFSTTKVQEMMYQAADDGADIVNMSLGVVRIDPGCGAPGNEREAERLVRDANNILGRPIRGAINAGREILWVFSAGNRCRDVRFASPASLVSPGHEGFPENTMAVANVDRAGILYEYFWYGLKVEGSNFGPLISVAAPGETVWSTVPPQLHHGNEYAGITGTSMSAPMVSGLAALLKCHDPSNTARDLKYAIVRGAEAWGDPVPGHGFHLISAYGALREDRPSGCGAPLWSALGGGPAPAGAEHGFSVASAGDVNGDGRPDVIVGAPYFVTAAGVVGKVYLYLGTPSGLDQDPAWTSTGDDQDQARFGISVASAGDVNGDRRDDVIVGASKFDATNPEAGKVYLFLGEDTRAGLSSLARWYSSGDGQGGAAFGRSVAGLGDVDGDGLADVIVGAPGFETTAPGAGKAYVYQGDRFEGLRDAPIWTYVGPGAGRRFGACVASAGDVDGDGDNEVIVGAPGTLALGLPSPSTDGLAFLFLGGEDAGVSLSAAWVGRGEAEPDAHFGWSVASAGDVNGDGHADIIVGDRPELPVSIRGVHLYLGSDSGLPEWPDQTLVKGDIYASFGWSVASAGDIDNDGLSDIIVGATDPIQSLPGVPNTGKAFVFLGWAGGLHPDTGMWVCSGDGQADAEFGYSVASAGDVDGDGRPDIIIGAPYHDSGNTDAGKVYIYSVP